MRKKTATEELLDDVLAEAAPGDFREELLGETLRQVRRRRRYRYARNVMGIFVALALLGVLIFPRHGGKPSIAVAPPKGKPIEKNYTLVSTRPLPMEAIITTHPLAVAQFTTSNTNIEVVETTRGNFRTINDDELLVLLAGHPAALIRVGPNSEKLVFANPQDAKGFPLN